MSEALIVPLEASNVLKTMENDKTAWLRLMRHFQGAFCPIMAVQMQTRNAQPLGRKPIEVEG